MVPCMIYQELVVGMINMVVGRIGIVADRKVASDIENADTSRVAGWNRNMLSCEFYGGSP